MLTSFLLTLKTMTNEAVVRFETEPGERMQVAFTVIRRGRDPLLAFVATLGWRRASRPVGAQFRTVLARRNDDHALAVTPEDGWALASGSHTAKNSLVQSTAC
jgi:transposase